MKNLMISLNAFAVTLANRQQIRADLIEPVITFRDVKDFMLNWTLRILLLVALLLPAFLVVRHFLRKKKNQKNAGKSPSDKGDL